MAKKTFRDKLKELRLAKGLSQAALARLCGISHQAVSLFESGQNVPLWRTVQLFTLALGVDCQHPLSDDDVELPSGTEPVILKRGRPKATAPAETPSRPTSKRSASKVIQEPVEQENAGKRQRRKKKEA